MAINLLPWREQARLRQNKRFMQQLLLVALLSLLLAMAVWQYFNHQLQSWQSANAYITQQIQAVNNQLGEVNELEASRTDMQQGVQTIATLQKQHNHKNGVQVWQDIANAVPQGVYLSSVSQEGEVVTIAGRYATNADTVANFVKRLALSPSFDKVNVRSLQSANSRNVANTTNPLPLNKFEIVSQLVVEQKVEPATQATIDGNQNTDGSQNTEELP